MFPETVDTIADLLRGFFRIGTFGKNLNNIVKCFNKFKFRLHLENDGWQNWFTNSTHPLTKKLIKDLELVANVDEGLSNVTKAFFWPYAFLGSRSQLEYIVGGNFTNEFVLKLISTFHKN